MAKINTPARKAPVFTHEGAPAAHIDPEQQLRRSVMACMLWEDTFYEGGVSIADRITETVRQVKPVDVCTIATEARFAMKLRHVPLLLARELARHPKLSDAPGIVTSTLSQVIQRPDELVEFLALYWKDKKQPLSAQVKRGLAEAFTKFDEYQLAKYNRDGAVKLRDVLFLCHAKPKDKAQGHLWKKLVDGKLKTPDTWEVALSGGADKKEAWTCLLKEEKLGALALLRNLRNMKEAGVSEKLIRDALRCMKTERVLPFRFISAARHAPQWEPELEEAMFKCLEGFPKLRGKTALLIDHSGSMQGPPVSAKSEIDRFDAACALAILIREVCERAAVLAFSTQAVLLAPRRGFALRDAIRNCMPFGNTMTKNAILAAKYEGYDRIIVVTDEQSHQSISAPDKGKPGYFINVATNQNGIGYGPWTHIDGWSESVLNYIHVAEES